MKVSNEFAIHKLGGVLKTERLSKKLTREQLAEKVGTGYRHLMGIENKNKTPSVNLLFRLIRALELPADKIFYPEKYANNSEKERLVRMIYLCDDKDIRIVTALLNELLDGKKA